ncbi:MAG: response regulator [Kiritimatiellae bacterium]|nr:response regulator [Kiritimatiellia bacterium]
MKDNSKAEQDPSYELPALRLHVDRLRDERSKLQNEVIELRRQLRRAEDRALEVEKIQKRLDSIMAIGYELNSPVQRLVSMLDLEPNPKLTAPINEMAQIVKRIREAEGLTAEQPAAAAAQHPAAAGLVPCDGERTLIVDDEEPIRELFGKILKEALPEVRIDYAANGQKGVELFKEGHPSVIVMDIAMPVMNGEVAFIEIQRVCREKAWKMPAVIFCTGFAPPESIRNLRMGEGHCYLPKPVTSATLVQAVKERLVWKAR